MDVDKPESVQAGMDKAEEMRLARLSGKMEAERRKSP